MKREKSTTVETYTKEIGKIKSIRFGFGGYQDAMMGFSIELGGKAWGVGDFKGTWATNSKGAKWTEEDRDKEFAKAVRFVWKLLETADKRDLNQLVNVPIEATFDKNHTLVSWRILTEVI